MTTSIHASIITSPAYSFKKSLGTKHERLHFAELNGIIHDLAKIRIIIFGQNIFFQVLMRLATSLLSYYFIPLTIHTKNGQIKVLANINSICQRLGICKSEIYQAMKKSENEYHELIIKSLKIIEANQEIVEKIANPLSGIKIEEAIQLLQFIEKNRLKWMKGFKNLSADCIYLRAHETQLPYDIQIFENMEIIIHTKKYLRKSESKKVTISIDFMTGEFFVKLKGDIASEVNIFNNLRGKKGIVEMKCFTEYSSKNPSKSKHQILIEKGYSHNLAQIQSFYNLNEEDLKIIILDLLNGLNEMHRYGTAHGDLTNHNILVDICPLTGKILKSAICDFGTTMNPIDIEEVYGRDEVIKLQSREVSILVLHIKKICEKNKLKIPKFLNNVNYYKPGEELNIYNTEQILNEAILYYS